MVETPRQMNCKVIVRRKGELILKDRESPAPRQLSKEAYNVACN